MEPGYLGWLHSQLVIPAVVSVDLYNIIYLISNSC
jgi:hypothetical protein